MYDAYDNAMARIRQDLQALMAISDAGGSDPTAAQAIKLWRLRKLEQQVREQMALYARSATKRTVNGQEEAIGQATRHTAEMVDAITVDSGHPVSASASSAMADLDRQAVSAIVGSTRRGSPLRRLFDDASTEGADAMVKVLRNGVIAGDDVRTISRGLEEAGKITRTRSVLIARTEVNRAYQEATHERIQDPEIFDGWIWSASLSPTTCAACLAKNGSRHKPSERMSDHPPRRCVQIPLVTGEDAPEIPDAGEWLKGQPARIQEACLGSRAAAEAFQRGQVNLSDFVAVHRSSVWGDSIQRNSLRRARVQADGAIAGTRTLIEDLIRTGRTPSSQESAHLLEHAASAHFSTRTVKTDPAAVGLEFHGARLEPYEPSVRAHLAKRTLIDRWWPYDTTEERYVSDLHGACRASGARMSFYNVAGKPRMAVLVRARTADRPEPADILVVYDALDGVLCTGFRIGDRQVRSLERRSIWHET